MLMRIWRKETLLRCWWKGKVVQTLWKTVWRFLKTLKMELPYDRAIALLGNYPKDTDVVKRRATCTPKFTAAISTIAKVWKELRCPSADEWIKKTKFRENWVGQSVECLSSAQVRIPGSWD